MKPKIDYVLSTIVIAYLCKKTNEPKYSTCKVEDVYPNLFNTRNIVNLVKHTDKYEVMNVEYNFERIDFTDFDDEICNPVN
tara:strand:- start:110 stop:352 length:243 start_codon:yes stop_codon:yes gene_type:complete